jgi:hypothetical protein
MNGGENIGAAAAAASVFRLAADAIDQQGFWSKREQPTLCLRIIHPEGPEARQMLVDAGTALHHNRGPRAPQLHETV